MAAGRQGRCRGYLGSPGVWGNRRWERPAPGWLLPQGIAARKGALPRGLGLSLKKAQTKEHHGAAAPWTPGGAKVLAPARRVLGPVGEGAIVGL